MTQSVSLGTQYRTGQEAELKLPALEASGVWDALSANPY